MASQAVDLYVLYQIIKRISTPFKDTDAFKFGLIDEKGKRLKKAKTDEEKKAMTYLDRFVFNIKRTLSKVGLDSKLATYAGALFLIKESETKQIPSEDKIIEGINEEMSYLAECTDLTFDELFEDAPAMATGPAVAGTGDDPVHWRHKGRPRRRGRAIDATAFLKRMLKRRDNEQRSSIRTTKN
jgi:hypothetical protein